MNTSLVLLHDEALRITHPVFKAAPDGTKTIYVWDDEYVQQANYSLKRLIFIYETLCELPIEIIHGNTLDVVRECAPSTLYVPASNNPLIAATIAALESTMSVQVIEDEAFASIKNPTDFQRFFNYWNEAEKTAFFKDGGTNA